MDLQILFHTRVAVLTVCAKYTDDKSDGKPTRFEVIIPKLIRQVRPLGCTNKWTAL